MLIVMSAAFFYRDFSYSRIVFGLIWVISIPLLYLFRAGVASIERKLHRRGRYLRPAVIIGGDALADNIFVRLQHHPSFGFDIAGYFSDSAAPEGLALAGEKCLGPIAAAPEYIIEHNVEIVFIALRAGEHHRLSALVTACVGINVEFMMVPDIMDILTSNLRMAEYEGLPFLRLKRNPITMWGRITKRIFDVVVSSVTLIVLSPAFLVIALFIKLDSRGPVFFRQKRVGLDGSEFTMYKFRSMAQGSERFDAHARLGIRNDPRQTTVGSFLRRMSLDELPQIYNVWKGEMSLVGPRPERTQFVEEFQQVVPKYLDRHRVKTGLTGWAQVNGFRGDTSLEERIRYDLYYIENWSLAFDIRILLKTLRASLVSRRLEY
jgi:exopolysaccharide biosynthesis polyprenyl glycosylphosphotransferase